MRMLRNLRRFADHRLTRALTNWASRVASPKPIPCCCCSSLASDTAESDLNRIAQHLLHGNVKRIVILAGAGISTASGIPDFRTPGSGLFDNLARYNLPWPEAIFDLQYFYSNPAPFYMLAKELYPTGRYRPNIAHYFVRLLHEKSLLLRMYTQNIDSLERMAGIPIDKLVEAHGTFLTATCTVCLMKAPTNIVKAAAERGEVARCPECHSVIKPDIVFFGENLPDSFWNYKVDMLNTDLVFIIGTSLEVYPFAEVAESVPKSVRRVLINRKPVGSFQFGKNSNDILILGEISESIERLSVLLNWQDELKQLMEQAEVNNSDGRF